MGRPRRAEEGYSDDGGGGMQTFGAVNKRKVIGSDAVSDDGGDGQVMGRKRRDAEQKNAAL